MTVTRRKLLSGCVGALANFALPIHTSAQRFVDASAFGVGQTAGDQTTALQMAIDAAIALQQPLVIGSGTYAMGKATITGPLTVRGTGQTVLRLEAGETILAIADCDNVVLEGVTFEGTGPSGLESALIDMVDVSNVVIRDCRLLHAAGSGIRAHNVQGRIEQCELSDIADTGIFSTNSRGLDGRAIP